MENNVSYPITSDHDALITLITEFNTTAKNIEHRITEDHASTLEVKEIVERQYESLTTRIQRIEADLLKLDPSEIAQLKVDMEKTKLWIHDFNRSKHIAWIIASAGFLIIGYYIPFILNSLTSTYWNLIHMH